MAFREFVAGSRKVNMDGLAIHHHTPRSPRPSDRQFDEVYRDRAMVRPKHQRIALAQKDHGVIGVAQTRR